MYSSAFTGDSEDLIIFIATGPLLFLMPPWVGGKRMVDALMVHQATVLIFTGESEGKRKRFALRLYEGKSGIFY
jgi:membrane protein CcdC involved in cytochrome C biogenesis